jgi:hypothetical protein
MDWSMPDPGTAMDGFKKVCENPIAFQSVKPLAETFIKNGHRIR